MLVDSAIKHSVWHMIMKSTYTGLCPKGSKGMWREIIDGYGITYEIKTSSAGY